MRDINTEQLTIEKWRPIAADTFPALYMEFFEAHGNKQPVILVMPLTSAQAHVFFFDDCSEMMILQYGDGKPICFRRR